MKRFLGQLVGQLKFLVEQNQNSNNINRLTEVKTLNCLLEKLKTSNITTEIFRLEHH